MNRDQSSFSKHPAGPVGNVVLSCKGPTGQEARRGVSAPLRRALGGRVRRRRLAVGGEAAPAGRRRRVVAGTVTPGAGWEPGLGKAGKEKGT